MSSSKQLFFRMASLNKLTSFKRELNRTRAGFFSIQETYICTKGKVVIDDFEIFDEDQDGQISSSEWIEKFVSAMNSTGITSMVGREMNAETFRVMFNDIDCEKDGNISPTEFKMLTNGEFCLQERWTWCIFGCCKPWWWWLWKVGSAIIKTIKNC